MPYEFDLPDGRTVRADGATPEEAWVNAQAQVQPREMGSPPAPHGIGYGLARGAANAVMGLASLPDRLTGRIDVDQSMSDLRGLAGIDEPSGHPYAEAAGGGIAGGLPGGPVGVIGGLAGGLTAEKVKQSGGGGLAQFGSGAAADFAASALARNVPGAIGAVRRLASPSARAGGYLQPLNLGVETAEDVTEAVRKSYGLREAQEGIAWDVAEDLGEKSITRTSSKPIRDVSEQLVTERALNPSDVPEVAKRSLTDALPDEVGVRELQQAKRAVSTISRQAGYRPELAPQAEGARRVGRAADEALDELERAGGADADAVKALRAARAESAGLHADFPDRSALRRQILSEIAPDDAQEAINKVLASPQRVQEVKLLIKATGTDESAKRGLRRAFVASIVGETPERAVVGADLKRLDKYEDVAREVLGPEGFRHFRRLIGETAKVRRSSPDFMRKTGEAATLGVGGALGAAMGGPTGAGIGAISAKTLMWLGQKMGPQAARNIAIEALYDPVLYRKLTQRAPSQSALDMLASDVTSYAARRGIAISSSQEGQE